MTIVRENSLFLFCEAVVMTNLKGIEELGRMRPLFLIPTLCCASIASAYFIHIDANEEQCFFDRVVSGTKMGLMFEVAEGGFLDIDVKVNAS